MVPNLVGRSCKGIAKDGISTYVETRNRGQWVGIGRVITPPFVRLKEIASKLPDYYLTELLTIA